MHILCLCVHMHTCVHVSVHVYVYVCRLLSGSYYLFMLYNFATLLLKVLGYSNTYSIRQTLFPGLS